MADSDSTALKDRFFTRAFADDLVATITTLYPSFDQEAFLAHVFDADWDSRSLLERMRHITAALRPRLPDDYRAALDVVRSLDSGAKAAEDELRASVTDPVRTIVTQDGWKLNRSTIGEDELYDLNTDPGETVNLFARPEHADRIIVQLVRRRDDTTIIENLIARLFADKDLHSRRVDAAVQQIEDQVLARESVEQAPQRLDIGQLGEVHQVGLTGQHIVAATLGLAEHLIGHVECRGHHSIQRLTGFAQFGPHRDRLEIGLKDRPLRRYGSQGEKRTASIALKLAQGELLYERTRQRPIVLLDDIFSELDRDRARRLQERCARDHQVFIATARPEDVEGWSPADRRTWRVENGSLSVIA